MLALPAPYNEISTSKGREYSWNTLRRHLSPLVDLAWGLVMQPDEICVCGHPQSLHRRYGCNGTLPNPDLKKTERIGCPVQRIQSAESRSRRWTHIGPRHHFSNLKLSLVNISVSPIQGTPNWVQTFGIFGVIDDLSTLDSWDTTVPPSCLA
jgi:hypothetical protein